MNGVGSLSEHTELIQPPQDVASAVTSRQSRVTADSQRDLSARALNLIGKLHASGRCAYDEDPTRRQLFGASIVCGH